MFSVVWKYSRNTQKILWKLNSSVLWKGSSFFSVCEFLDVGLVPSSFVYEGTKG